MQYVIEDGPFLYGPFHTPEEAYQWAAEQVNFPIHIRELRWLTELGPRTPTR